MTLQAIPGIGLHIEAYDNVALAPSFNSSLLIDASGEKAAFIGRFFNKDRASKDVTKIHFRFGAVTKAGGSTVQVSLQDLSTTSGPPGQPDETADQSITIANADAGFTSNAWYTTGALSANRTLAFGELVAVVFEFGTFGGADSVVISQVTANASESFCHGVLKTGGSWAISNHVPCVVLECTDGVFGTLQGAFPTTGFNTHTYKQDTGTADEYALEFQVPFPCTLTGVRLPFAPTAATSDFSVIVYDGTTPMTGGTVTVDANTLATTNVRWMNITFSQAIALQANYTYRLSIQPTQTTQTVTVYSFDVNAAGHFQCHAGGTTWAYATRLDLGAWSSTATRRLIMQPRFGSFDDGTATGGGGGVIGE